VKRLVQVLLVLVLTTACLGPKPKVRSVEVGPPEDGKARVTVVVANEGNGDGQVEVEVTLRQDEKVVARESTQASLKPRESITLVLELDVPDDAQDLDAEAEAHYPPP
jgi:uncharacterized membrane protein